MGKKHPVNEQFFNTWSKDMAYILGFIYADGSLHDVKTIRAKYLRVTSTDKPVLDFIKKTLNSDHPIKQIESTGKDKFLFQVGSHKIFNSLALHGLAPNKSLTCTFPHVPKKYLPDFLRGYFDGDGCVHVEYQNLKNGKVSPKRLRIIFTSGSKKFLTGITQTLLSAKVQYAEKLYKSSRAYRLIFSTRESLDLCAFMYKDPNSFCFKRKKSICLKYIASREI